MRHAVVIKLLAWAIALTLVLLPIVGVLNGWFAADRWPVHKLNVHAEFSHVSAEQIRAAALPELGAGFFAVDLDAIRDAVAQLPWVARVEARKQWPDMLDLTVHELQPYARWGDDRLISRTGQIFKVPGAGDLQGLPKLAGPDSRMAEVLDFYEACRREFSGSGLAPSAVAVSGRGSWEVTLNTGAVIELGRDDTKARLQRFLDVWPKLVGSQPGMLAYVDLRYENGFALRWVAPTTTPAAADTATPDENT